MSGGRSLVQQPRCCCCCFCCRETFSLSIRVQHAAWLLLLFHSSSSSSAWAKGAGPKRDHEEEEEGTVWLSYEAVAAAVVPSGSWFWRQHAYCSVPRWRSQSDALPHAAAPKNPLFVWDPLVCHESFPATSAPCKLNLNTPELSWAAGLQGVPTFLLCALCFFSLSWGFSFPAGSVTDVHTPVMGSVISVWQCFPLLKYCTARQLQRSLIFFNLKELLKWESLIILFYSS